MKKQAKSKNVRSVKTSEPKQVVVAHNGRQRVLGFIALAGLFLCGLFVGMAIKTPTMDVMPDVSDVPETQIAEYQPVTEVTEPADVCVEVERLLSRHLVEPSDDVDSRIERAKVYASLAERGCPENYEAYIKLASEELEIARAIDDDKFDRDETIEVVETYKRIHMQNAANEIFEKAKKLTDPTIDFIIQVEKIINE